MLKAHLTLQSTPFHHFVGAPAVIDSYLLDDLCSGYQGNEKFFIGGKELTCRVEDFGRILGALYIGEYINMNRSDYHNDFFDNHLHSRSLTGLQSLKA